MKILLLWGNSLILQTYVSNVAEVNLFQTRAENKTPASLPLVPLTHGQVHSAIRVREWWVANLVLHRKPLCKKDTCFNVTRVECSRVWDSAAPTLWSISLAAGKRSMDNNRCLTSKKSRNDNLNDCERLIKNFYYIWFINTIYLRY